MTQPVELLPIEPSLLARTLGERQSFLPCLERAGALEIAYFFRAADARVVAQVSFHKDCQGPPGYVHGGLTAAVLDETMAVVLLHAGQTAATGRLQVNFLRPISFPDRYFVEAWMTDRDPLSVVLKARLLDGQGVEFASASARFIFVA